MDRLCGILLLCSAGIYIGRVHRFNSWDVIARPQQLLDLVAARLADPLGRPETLFALAGLTGFLAIAYLVLYTISDLGPAHRERERYTCRGSCKRPLDARHEKQGKSFTGKGTCTG